MTHATPSPDAKPRTPYRTEDALRKVEELQAELDALRQSLQRAPEPQSPPARRISGVRVGIGLVALMGATFGMAAMGLRHRPPAVESQAVFAPPPPAVALVPGRASTMPIDAHTHENLRGVWSGPDGAFVVGDHGTALFRDADGGVSAVPTGTREALYAVTGSPVLAVGDRATVLRFATDTKAWVQEPMPRPGADLRAVDALATAAVAVGMRGQGYLRVAEGSWAAIKLGDADLFGVALCAGEESEPHAVVAAGADGTIVVAPLETQGSRFRLGTPKRQKVPTDATLRSVHCDGSQVVVAGDRGVVLSSALGADQPWVLGEAPGATLRTLSTFRVNGDWTALALGRDRMWARGTDGAWRKTPFEAQDGAFQSMAILSDDTLGTALLVVGDGGAMARVDLSP